MKEIKHITKISNVDLNEKKTERFEARLTSEQKQLLKVAAQMEGSSMAEFASRAISNAVLQTIQKYQIISLSREDSIKFCESLLNPPALSTSLDNAISDFDEKYKD